MYRDHTDTLNVGARAPHFELSTADGRRIALDSFRGAPLLLFFLRGSWCPNCRKLLERLNQDRQEFADWGVAIACIAAQRIDGMARARRFVEDHPYPFPILFDERRTVTREWGVYRRVGVDALHIAHPAVFLLDPGQTIRWIAVSPNQFTRPSTRELLDAVTGVPAVEETHS